MPKISLLHFSPTSIQKDVAKLIAEQLILAANQNKKTLILLSGGSAINMYKLISEFIPRSQDLSKLSFSLVDERCSKNKKDSNEQQLLDSGVIEEFEIRGAKFISWQVKNSAETACHQRAGEISDSYEDLLENHDDKIALLGLGEDGHTAGWLPTLSEDKFFKLYGKDAAVNYYKVDLLDSDNPHKLRLTSTIRTIKQMDKIIIYAKGKGKLKAIEKLLAQGGEINLTPARILLEFDAQLIVITDQDLS